MGSRITGKKQPLHLLQKTEKDQGIVCGQIAVVALFYDRVWKRKEKGAGEGRGGWVRRAEMANTCRLP